MYIIRKATPRVILRYYKIDRMIKNICRIIQNERFELYEDSDYYLVFEVGDPWMNMNLRSSDTDCEYYAEDNDYKFGKVNWIKDVRNFWLLNGKKPLEDCPEQMEFIKKKISELVEALKDDNISK